MSAPTAAAVAAGQPAEVDALSPIGDEPIRRESKSRRLQSLLKPSTFDALKGRARSLGLSVNDTLNRILEKELGTEARKCN